MIIWIWSSYIWHLKLPCRDKNSWHSRHSVLGCVFDSCKIALLNIPIHRTDGIDTTDAERVHEQRAQQGEQSREVEAGWYDMVMFDKMVGFGAGGWFIVLTPGGRLHERNHWSFNCCYCMYTEAEFCHYCTCRCHSGAVLSAGTDLITWLGKFSF